MSKYKKSCANMDMHCYQTREIWTTGVTELPHSATDGLMKKLICNCVFNYCTSFTFRHIFLKILLHITFSPIGDRYSHKDRLCFALRSTCLSYLSFSPHFFKYEHSLLIFFSASHGQACDSTINNRLSFLQYETSTNTRK
jgi:hypothetical protein